MLTVVHRLDKHCSCHLQGDHVLFALLGRFWQTYVGQGVGDVLVVIKLAGGAKDLAAIQ
jgi:hypothetical protein